MKAVKGNKVYTIDEKQKDSYRAAGFDIVSDSGEVLEYGKGKTVPYEEYASVRKELEELKENVADASHAGEAEAGAVKILMAYADEHGIDIGKSKSLSGIVRKINEQMEEAGDLA